MEAVSVRFLPNHRRGFYRIMELLPLAWRLVRREDEDVIWRSFVRCSFGEDKRATHLRFAQQPDDLSEKQESKI